MVAPVIEGLADEYAAKGKIAKINADDTQQTAMKFRVMSIPTVIVFKDGEVSEILVGPDLRGDKYRKMLNNAVPSTVTTSAYSQKASLDHGRFLFLEPLNVVQNPQKFFERVRLPGGADAP
jgi:thioredoxin-like negative regulator of GroEL